MKLEANHIVWIFTAAADHFRDAARKLEQECVLLEQGYGETLYSNLPGLNSKEQKLERNKRYIAQYNDIVAFCEHAKQTASEKLAEQFAKDFADYLKGKEHADKTPKTK